MMSRMRWFAALLALAIASAPAAIQAQSWPAKPIKLVVPFAAGGGNDILARAISGGLGTALGVPVVVENKPGAGGNIGAEMVAKGAPDGYTYLVVAQAILNFNPHLYSKLPFDPVKDFDAVALLGVSPLVLVVNADVPARSVDEFIALAKAKPDSLSYASAGAGTPHHLAGELFKAMAGVSIMHVPYKGGAPAAMDLIAGRVQMMLAPINNVMPHIASGRVRVLGVGGDKRIASLPSVPTVAEAGVPNFNVEHWYGIVAPAGTPKPVISRLNKEIAQVLARPEVIKAIQQQGMEPAIVTPEALTEIIASGFERWGTVIKNAGIKLD